MSKKISIKKIADLSGVSIATVSRVINNNGRFSESTKAKVLRVIKENDYTINTMAQGLRNQKSSTVGIVIPDLNNSFFADLVGKIEQKLFLKGYSTIICDTNRDPNKENGYLKMLESKSVDGLILISGSKTSDTSSIPHDIPIVCIDRQSQNQNIMYVGSNHYQGAVLATQRLIEAGTTPSLVTGSRISTSITDRIQGFKTTMIKKNLRLQETSIIKLTEEQDNSPDTRRQELRKILRKLLSKSDTPVGVFAISDALAADLLIAAHSLLISVPNELKVIGFDDSPIAKYCYPELTTIKQDTNKITDYASSYLISSMQNHENTLNGKIKLIDVSLINRSTV